MLTAVTDCFIRTQADSAHPVGFGVFSVSGLLARQEVGVSTTMLLGKNSLLYCLTSYCRICDLRRIRLRPVLDSAMNVTKMTIMLVSKPLFHSCGHEAK